MYTFNLKIERDLPNECKIIDALCRASLNTGKISPILRTILVAHCAGIPFSTNTSTALFDPVAVFQTIRVLEGKTTKDTTKGPIQFKNGLLKGLWKKHFFQASFISHNILDAINDKQFNGEERIHRALNRKFGNEESWKGKVFEEADLELVVRTLVGDSLDERAAGRAKNKSRGLTGEHLIFSSGTKGKTYLFVATHSIDYEMIWQYVKSEI